MAQVALAKETEVEAIVAHCFAQRDLAWLGEVVVALATTGLRIGELAQLRWSDVELSSSTLNLKDTRRTARRSEREGARSTKSHRDRSLPIHADLLAILQKKERRADGLIFHGPLGGRLKPDTLRNVLQREVLAPLAKTFPSSPGEKGFRDGRLHSFRHYFCSTCANNGTPEQMVMSWLGHRDSKMVRHYYHLHQEEAKRQMAQIPSVTRPVASSEAPATDAS